MTHNPFYFPSDIMTHIISYLPTPLDNHKKRMKTVNEDFKIIERQYYFFNPYYMCNQWYYLNRLEARKWNLVILEERLKVKREKELTVVSRALNYYITEVLKTKKNIINNFQHIVNFTKAHKREKKAQLIIGLRLHLEEVFKNPYQGNRVYNERIETFIYELIPKLKK